MKVRFSDPLRMNLIGYFLRDILRTGLSFEDRRKVARSLNSSILFDVNGMLITVSFGREFIEIAQGAANQTSAKISGDLNALIEIALGDNYLKYLITGRIKIGGNLFKLLKLIKLMRLAN